MASQRDIRRRIGAVRNIKQITRAMQFVAASKLRRAQVPLEAHFAGFGDRPTFADVLPLSRLVTDSFLDGSVATVDIIFSRFVSTLVQRPATDRLLPVDPAED